MISPYVSGICCKEIHFWREAWGQEWATQICPALPWQCVQETAQSCGGNLSGALLSPENTAFLPRFAFRKLCITRTETALFLTRQCPTAKKLHVKPTVCVRKAHPEVPFH